MTRRSTLFAGCVLVSAQAYAQAPQPSAMLLAQAQDRCMATQAVQLSKTAANDADIYAKASESCAALGRELDAAIAQQYSPEQARQLGGMLKEQAEPNFMRMLQKIRADRQAAAGR